MQAAPSKSTADFAPPHPLQFEGSRLARWVLQCLGWRVTFEEMPEAQGVVIA